MNEQKTGGFAFPWCGDLNDCPTINLGMSLRDYFAAKAMQAAISGSMANGATLNPETATIIVQAAFVVSDLMLAERAK